MFAVQADRTELRVLLVDDAPFYRRIACELLARRGYEVAGEAETIAAALRLAEAIQPDAALVDVTSPMATASSWRRASLGHIPGWPCC